jgi:hypothetical protein
MEREKKVVVVDDTWLDYIKCGIPESLDRLHSLLKDYHSAGDMTDIHLPMDPEYSEQDLGSYVRDISELGKTDDDDVPREQEVQLRATTYRVMISNPEFGIQIEYEAVLDLDPESIKGRWVEPIAEVTESLKIIADGEIVGAPLERRKVTVSLDEAVEVFPPSAQDDKLTYAGNTIEHDQILPVMMEIYLHAISGNLHFGLCPDLAEIATEKEAEAMFSSVSTDAIDASLDVLLPGVAIEDSGSEEGPNIPDSIPLSEVNVLYDKHGRKMLKRKDLMNIITSAFANIGNSIGKIRGVGLKTGYPDDPGIMSCQGIYFIDKEYLFYCPIDVFDEVVDAVGLKELSSSAMTWSYEDRVLPRVEEIIHGNLRSMPFRQHTDSIGMIIMDILPSYETMEGSHEDSVWNMVYTTSYVVDRFFDMGYKGNMAEDRPGILSLRFRKPADGYMVCIKVLGNPSAEAAFGQQVAQLPEEAKNIATLLDDIIPR